jgi:hypothetical protein
LSSEDVVRAAGWQAGTRSHKQLKPIHFFKYHQELYMYQYNAVNSIPSSASGQGEFQVSERLALALKPMYEGVKSTRLSHFRRPRRCKEIETP